jgi:hypothetical protein
MVEVRTMRSDELARACEIVAAQGLCEREERLAARLGPIAAAATSDFLVAESGGELVGVLLSTFDGFSHLVSHMAVAPGHERRGDRPAAARGARPSDRERGGRNIVVASWLTAAGFYHSRASACPAQSSWSATSDRRDERHGRRDGMRPARPRRVPGQPPGRARRAARDCWAVQLPGDRMAWFPMNLEGARRLATERQVLDLLAARCSFKAPRVVHADEAGWQLRELVPGVCEPWALYRRTGTDRALARRIGRGLGGILAEQHTRVGPEDVAGWLPDRLSWPEPSERLWAALPRVVADPGLLRAIGRVIRRYEEEVVVGTAPGDRVLVHGDLGLHNVALAPGTDEVAGVFDYEGAAWDRPAPGLPLPGVRPRQGGDAGRRARGV